VGHDLGIAGMEAAGDVGEVTIASSASSSPQV